MRKEIMRSGCSTTFHISSFLIWKSNSPLSTAFAASLKREVTSNCGLHKNSLLKGLMVPMPSLRKDD